MAYLGNAPAEKYISFERQVFTIVNSQTAYTLSHSVTNENDIRLVVNNIVQEPGSGKAYTASGTTLTLSAALTNGTDEMYCVFLGRALQTVNPPNASVGSDQTAPTIITGQTALTVSPDTTDEIILSDAGTLKRADISVLGNAPAFSVRLTADQSVSSDTNTKIQFNSEDFDTDSAFDSSSNYRFTVPSGEGGKYFFYVQMYGSSDAGDDVNQSAIYVYKNGTNQGFSGIHIDDEVSYFVASKSMILTLSAGDYIEFFGNVTTGSGTPLFKGQSTRFDTHALGYKMIGI